MQHCFCLFLYFFSLCIRRPTVKCHCPWTHHLVSFWLQFNMMVTPTLKCLQSMSLKGRNRLVCWKSVRSQTVSNFLCVFMSFISSCNFRTMQIHWDEDVTWCFPHWFHWLKINQQKIKNSIKCHWHIVRKSNWSFKLSVNWIFLGFVFQSKTKKLPKKRNTSSNQSQTKTINDFSGNYCFIDNWS